MRKKEFMPRVKRTREEMQANAEQYTYCYVCKEKLKEVSQTRMTSKLCPSCRGDAQSDNTHLKQIYRDMQNNPIEPSEDEMMFEDDPKANAEVDYGRVKRNATQVNFGVSGLADIMSPSNYYVKRGRPKKTTVINRSLK